MCQVRVELDSSPIKAKGGASAAEKQRRGRKQGLGHLGVGTIQLHGAPFQDGRVRPLR